RVSVPPAELPTAGQPAVPENTRLFKPLREFLGETTALSIKVRSHAPQPPAQPESNEVQEEEDEDRGDDDGIAVPGKPPEPPGDGGVELSQGDQAPVTHSPPSAVQSSAPGVGESSERISEEQRAPIAGILLGAGSWTPQYGILGTTGST